MQKIGKAIGNFHYVLNRGLWDFYMPGQMVQAAEGIFAKEMRLRPRTSPEEIANLRYEISKHINKVFGTESLESMLLSPKVRFLLNFALFAPVWTFSNLRVITNAFQSEAAWRMTGRWIAGGAAAWFVTSNLANLATTGWIYSGQEGPAPDKDGVRRAHAIWDNPGGPIKLGGKYVPGVTDNSTNIFNGYNPDGTESYIRFGKGYREAFQAVYSPYSYITQKLSLPVRTALAIATGHEPGTGYEVLNLRNRPEEIAVQTAMILSESFMPFVLQDMERWAERRGFPELVPEQSPSQARVFGIIPLGLPTKKGITATRAVDAYEQAMDDHQPEIAKQILEVARLNNIRPASVIQGWKDKQRKRHKTAIGRGVRYTTSGEAVPVTE
jgi:hypothetical protein